MNRRSFFSTLAKATVGFTILPGAGRIWKAVSVCPDDGLRYRCNSLGIYENLKACDRMLVPVEGISSDAILKLIYGVKRTREMDRFIVNVFCDRATANKLKAYDEHTFLS